jgi:hypothetical protein
LVESVQGCGFFFFPIETESENLDKKTQRLTLLTLP